MTELKPCPFCRDGGKPRVWRKETCSWPVYIVKCSQCGAGRGLFRYSEQEAIEAWNTRYEPTCKNIAEPPKEGFWPSPHFKCDKCGYENVSMDYLHYCGGCGAKVRNECTMNRVYLYDEEAVDGIECSECGWSGIHDHDDPLPDTCPNCKAKVIEE